MGKWAYSPETVETIRKGGENILNIPPDAKPNPPVDWEDRFLNPDATFPVTKWHDHMVLTRASMSEGKQDKNGDSYDLVIINFQGSERSQFNKDMDHLEFLMLYDEDEGGRVNERTKQALRKIDQIVQAANIGGYEIDDDGKYDFIGTLTGDKVKGCELLVEVNQSIKKNDDGDYDPRCEFKSYMQVP